MNQQDIIKIINDGTPNILCAISIKYSLCRSLSKNIIYVLFFIYINYRKITV